MAPLSRIFFLCVCVCSILFSFVLRRFGFLLSSLQALTRCPITRTLTCVISTTVEVYLILSMIAFIFGLFPKLLAVEEAEHIGIASKFSVLKAWSW